jgi:hypothetical protein
MAHLAASNVAQCDAIIDVRSHDVARFRQHEADSVRPRKSLPGVMFHVEVLGAVECVVRQSVIARSVNTPVGESSVTASPRRASCRILAWVSDPDQWNDQNENDGGHPKDVVETEHGRLCVQSVLDEGECIGCTDLER